MRCCWSRTIRHIIKSANRANPTVRIGKLARKGCRNSQMAHTSPAVRAREPKTRLVSARDAARVCSAVHRDSRPKRRKGGAASAAHRLNSGRCPAAHCGVRGWRSGRLPPWPRMPRTWRRRLQRAPAARRRRSARGRESRRLASTARSREDRARARGLADTAASRSPSRLPFRRGAR